jgi:glycosyltransferase involved in cell wall biosynthesis
LRALEPLVAEGLELKVWCARPSALFDELHARGFDVAGAVRPLRYSLARLREPPGAARRLAAVPGSLRAFRSQLMAFSPDVVHANATLSLPEAVVARRCGFPVLFHYHEAGWPGPKGRVLGSAAGYAADAIAAVSSANAASLRASAPALLILPEPAPPDRPPQSLLRSPGDPLIVATAGAISPRKGSDLFVAMAERLSPAHPKLAFELAGGTEDAPSADWVNQLKKRAAAADVVWRGRVDVEAELPRWDVVVVPSRADPFPLVVLEAMSAARAIVGADRGGISEQLSDGAGVVVPGEDVEALATAVLELAEDPERRAILGAAAYARVRANFTAEQAARRLQEAYELTFGRAAATGRKKRGRHWYRDATRTDARGDR